MPAVKPWEWDGEVQPDTASWMYRTLAYFTARDEADAIVNKRT